VLRRVGMLLLVGVLLFAAKLLPPSGKIQSLVSESTSRFVRSKHFSRGASFFFQYEIPSVSSGSLSVV